MFDSQIKKRFILGSIKNYLWLLIFAVPSTYFVLSENLYALLTIPLLLVAILVHPIYILFLIILLNPISDLLVTKYPSLLTKVSIDILILLFICVVVLRKIVNKEKWISYPFYKWIFIISVFYIISGIATWTGPEDLLFMNWIHFRFIYFAIAVTLLSYDDKKISQLINLLLIVFIFHIGIGVFQVVGGEWAKNLFYSYEDQVSLSFRTLEFRSYDTASSFNPAGTTYIYSTFYLPGHCGGYLLIMLSLIIGLRLVLGEKKWNNTFEGIQPFYISLVSRRNIFILLFLLAIILIILTYSRSAYLGLITLISILIFFSKKPVINNILYTVLYTVGFIIFSLLITNLELVFDFLKDIQNPGIGVFDPIGRFFSIFPSYVFENTPRKIAYYEILPMIILQKPLIGFGVTSALNKGKLLLDSFELNNALFYVFGDVGIVRIFVEYGVIGTIIFGTLFFFVFKYAMKGYVNANRPEYRAICLSVMFGILLSIPLNIGTMLMLSKPFGLYLWMLIGLSQKWQK